MKFYKCEVPGCGEYIPEDELKRVKYDNKIINICMICDDDSFEPIHGGDNVDTIEKNEKFRKKRNQQNK